MNHTARNSPDDQTETCVKCGNQPQIDVEERTYLGPDPGSAGEHLWLDPDAEIITYPPGARVPGGLYTIDVHRCGQWAAWYSRPAYTGTFASDGDQIQVRALHTETLQKAARLEANTSQSESIDRAIAPLMYLAASMPEPADRRALLEYITQRLYSA